MVDKNYKTITCSECGRSYFEGDPEVHYLYCSRHEGKLAGITYPEEKENDMVSHPAHYTFSKYEVLDVLTEWFPNEPLLWQVVKYCSRAKHKGKELEDLKKARFYLNKKIEMLEKNNEK